MDARKEIVERINDSIKTQSHLDGKDHSGDDVVVFVPAPRGLSIDCGKVDDIDLDDTKIIILEDQKIRDGDGNIVFDAESIGCVVYKVTGKVRPARDST